MGYELQGSDEIERLVDFDAAEADAAQGCEPNWQLFLKDGDYRRRYMTALVAASLRSVSLGVLMQVVRTLLAARVEEEEMVGCEEF